MTTFIGNLPASPRVGLTTNNRLAGPDGAGTLIGDAAGDVFGAPFSADTLLGGNGNDVLAGDAGGDLRALDSDTSIVGGYGTLRGGSGNDHLSGDAGRNIHSPG
ncbi:MAG TPA: hypothetical protein VE033_12525 [Acetobacteraceae bacterium]|nr:hypothetical protein [Acetobacteraceae bacterium]